LARSSGSCSSGKATDEERKKAQENTDALNTPHLDKSLMECRWKNCLAAAAPRYALSSGIDTGAGEGI
jgi:hypothetical protein